MDHRAIDVAPGRHPRARRPTAGRRLAAGRCREGRPVRTIDGDSAFAAKAARQGMARATIVASGRGSGPGHRTSAARADRVVLGRSDRVREDSRVAEHVREGPVRVGPGPPVRGRTGLRPTAAIAFRPDRIAREARGGTIGRRRAEIARGDRGVTTARRGRTASLRSAPATADDQITRTARAPDLGRAMPPVRATARAQDRDQPSAPRRRPARIFSGPRTSSLPADVRSRRSSSPTGRPGGCSSSPIAGMPSSASSFTPPASGSRSSRSKAAR